MSELKKRIITSFFLIVALYLSLIYKSFLFVALFLITFVIIYEFSNIFFRVFKKNKFFNFIAILITLVYLIYFALTIWLFLNSNIDDNKILFLFIISISIATDIGGYVFGKTFKGKKITKISPNKTYSGMAGSFILSLLTSLIFVNKVNLSDNIFILTILLSLISQIGDLFISYLKRKANVKDTGKFLPGHGGLLDRIDGILITLPVGLILIF